MSPYERGMVYSRILAALVVALFVTSACGDPARLASAPSERPSFSLAPGDGNGRKYVIPIDFTDVVTCPNGAALDRHLAGWAQVQVFDQPNPFLLHELKLVLTYSNAAGVTFQWRESHTDHLNVDVNGNLIDRVSGRDGVDGAIGHIVGDANTGEITFLKGRVVGVWDDQACAALS